MVLCTFSALEPDEHAPLVESDPSSRVALWRNSRPRPRAGRRPFPERIRDRRHRARVWRQGAGTDGSRWGRDGQGQSLGVGPPKAQDDAERSRWSARRRGARGNRCRGGGGRSRCEIRGGGTDLTRRLGVVTGESGVRAADCGPALAALRSCLSLLHRRQGAQRRRLRRFRRDLSARAVPNRRGKYLGGWLASGRLRHLRHGRAVIRLW